jgi:protein-S-isoprenylcysteine O-methyltransferase Ste14
MNNQTPQTGKLSPGKKGEYLVVLQFVLMAGFIVLPVWPQLAGTELFKKLATIRWTALFIFSGYALIFGALSFYAIRNYLTPLPYPTENNKLVTTGIYSIVRHPIYSGALFAAFGWSVYQMSLSHLLLTGIGLLFFNYKASREEEWLRARHPEYNSYVRRVKKFIPRLF